MQRRKSNQKNKKIQSYVGIAFVICTAVLILLNFLTPDKEMSEEENRGLAAKPKLTLDSVISGDYMDKYENYQADQFVGRNTWRKLQVSLSRLGGSKEENGVFIGKSHQLLADIETPEQDTLNENLKAINRFAQDYKDVKMNMLLVPDSATILKEKLPFGAVVADQQRMISQVKRELDSSVGWIDASAPLNKHADEKIYYKTDPHWTSQGAFYVFSAAAETMGIETDPASTFVSYSVTTGFNGTLAAKSGCRLDEKEVIDIYVPKETDNDLVVNYVDEQKKTTSLYDSSKLKTRDKYAVFLGGNSSLIDIKTVSESKQRLLLVKDSFANSFIPFLTPYYREIIVVDPRYYTGTMQDIMETYHITDALFLYSGNTFFRDNNISGVLYSE